MKGFTKENLYYGLEDWQSIVNDCSDCTDHGENLFQVCFVHGFVLKKLHEIALGMVTEFCYCIDCDAVVCRDMPRSVCQFICDRHQDRSGCTATVITEQRDLEDALEQFRGRINV